MNVGLRTAFTRSRKKADTSATIRKVWLDAPSCCVTTVMWPSRPLMDKTRAGGHGMKKPPPSGEGFPIQLI